MRKALRFLRFVAFWFISALPAAYAWENHAFGTWAALLSMPELSKISQVQVETLESFLRAEKNGLVSLLLEEEAWARKSVLEYPARPDQLAFHGKDLKGLKLEFLSAIRVNPAVPLSLFLQEIPNHQRAPKAVEADFREFTTLPDSVPGPQLKRFVRVKEGQSVSSVAVLATASDEPDYGLDIHLWGDNPGHLGKDYQFGNQPFGNPVLEFASQAPFHMGFFHEPSFAYTVAPYLKRTYPEYRIHLYYMLARYAMKTGHPYWAFRFAGWGVHYIQDLTQPYHSTVVPGANFFKMVFLGVLDKIGIHSPSKKVIQLLTNEHLALETYQFQMMTAALLQGQDQHPVLASVGALKDGNYGVFNENYSRQVVAKQSYELSQATHDVLMKAFPARLVKDPTYLFGVTDPKVDVLKEVSKSGVGVEQELQKHLYKLLGNFGSHTRNYIRAIF